MVVTSIFSVGIYQLFPWPPFDFCWSDLVGAVGVVPVLYWFVMAVGVAVGVGVAVAAS